MIVVSVVVVKHIGEGVLVIGHLDQVMVGHRMIVARCPMPHVFFVAKVNMTVDFLGKCQYMLHHGKDVLQVVKVQVFGMIGGFLSL